MDNIHLDTINRLNLLILQHHARYNDNLQPVLVYRVHLKDNPQQIDQVMKQKALENWKAFSDLSEGNLRWDQIQDHKIWESVRAYRQLTAMSITIDHTALENTAEIDQMLKSLNWQYLEQVITEEIPSYVADPKFSNDKRLQIDLIQSIYFIRSIKILYDFNDDKYHNAIKGEIIDFVYKAHQKDVQRVISLTFLSKVLGKEDQHRVLAIHRPDSLVAYSRARLAEQTKWAETLSWNEKKAKWRESRKPGIIPDLKTFKEQALACRPPYDAASYGEKEIEAAYHLYEKARQGAHHNLTILGRSEVKVNEKIAIPSTEYDPRIDQIMKENFKTMDENPSGDKGCILDSKKWSCLGNDAWILGGIHAGTEFQFASPITWDNLWNKEENRPKMIAREVIGLVTSGFELKSIEGKYGIIAYLVDKEKAMEASLQTYRAEYTKYDNYDDLQTFFESLDDSIKGEERIRFTHQDMSKLNSQIKSYEMTVPVAARQLTEEDYQKQRGLMSTPEGLMSFKPGDYLIRGTYGTQKTTYEYPISQEYFTDHYELHKRQAPNGEGFIFYKALHEKEAIQIQQPFIITTSSGETLVGRPNDYLVRFGTNMWIANKEIFEENHQVINRPI